MVETLSASSSETILILTPFGKDSEHLCKVLGAEGFVCHECRSLSELVSKLDANAAAILTTEEVVASKDSDQLSSALKQQPVWSAIPVLVFYSQRGGEEILQSKRVEPIHQI